MLSSDDIGGHQMARGKPEFLDELAERAEADLKTVDRHRVAFKLNAIVAVTRHTAEKVADIIRVAPQTIWRWAKAYKEEGLGGLQPKPKRPKPSKLTKEQKGQALKWLDEAKTPDGRHAHWTLEKLRQAFIDEFNVELGTTTIWTWLRKEGRKLKVPRPKHYKADVVAQEEFKKKLPRSRKTTRMP
ncbi:MAG: helix-turn-helix domain-containing protein [Holophagaceae bacterium]|nr:helix-turn-helix domain-containing protein [Holophagaceae bacterium]